MEGNQPAAWETTSLAIDSFDPPAARSVRLEGAGFYLHGRVRVVLSAPRRLRFAVRGARRFDVSVVVGESGKAAVTCDCAAFRDQQTVCRHVWAALIKTQNDGLLPNAVD